jgi:hypothetical protein
VLVFALAAAHLPCCSGGTATPVVADTFGNLLQGAYAVCAKGDPQDSRHVMWFHGDVAEVRLYRHPTRDATCGGIPELVDDESEMGTFTIGGSLSVPAPDGVGSVTARALDFAGSTGTHRTIVYMDTAATPRVLYTGDATGPTDAAGRAQRLQIVGRSLVASPAAWPDIANGSWKSCWPGTQDVTEWVVVAGAIATSWRYEHAGSTGTCSGDGRLVGGNVTALTFGPEVVTSVGALQVVAHEIDAVDPTGAASTYYMTAWADGLSVPATMYGGDDTGANDGSSPGLRARPLAIRPAANVRVAEPAYPAALNGTWRACTTERRGGDAAPVDYGEEVMIVTSSTSSVHAWASFESRYGASSDGTCTGTSARVRSASGTFEVTGFAPRVLAAGASSWRVTAALMTSQQELENGVALPRLYHTILYLDPYAPTPTHYAGKVTPTLDGSTPEKRPELLDGSAPRTRM